MSFDFSVDAQQQISRWLAMAEVTAKRTIAKAVEGKVLGRKCLVCGEKANGNRGLCTADYLRFTRAMSSIPVRERAAFEEQQIKEGRILAAGAARKIRNPNPFTTEAKG
jgi:hypothetical protein